MGIGIGSLKELDINLMTWVVLKWDKLIKSSEEPNSTIYLLSICSDHSKDSREVPEHLDSYSITFFKKTQTTKKPNQNPK